MKKTLFIISIAIFAISLLLSSPNCVPAGEKHVHLSYKQMINKSRSVRGYTNHGKVLYNYQEIDEFDDAMEGEEIGNFTIQPHSHVREIHNTVIIHDKVSSKKDDLAIGQINIERRRPIGTIDNSVTIAGDVETSGESMEIGTVRIGRRGRVGRVENEVTIKGGVNVR